MGRARYQITDQDAYYARRWLRGKIEEYDWLLPGEDFARQAKARRAFGDLRDAVTLNAWCEQYLTRDQWRQMQQAIRAARLRFQRGGSGRPVGVDLSHRAHLMLSTLAKRDGVTLSAVIERYLDPEYTAALLAEDDE